MSNVIDNLINPIPVLHLGKDERPIAAHFL